MSKPPVNPQKTLAGIAVDPHTLDRVIPESRRADGSVRKQLKIRPGFTPQEDVSRFRGTRQSQMDANALPKGHIIGWTPPPTKTAEPSKPLGRSAKKNAKRKEKRDEKRMDDIKDNWEDDDEEPEPAKKTEDQPKPLEPSKTEPTNQDENELTSKLEGLDVK